MKSASSVRGAFAVLLFLAIAGTGWLISQHGIRNSTQTLAIPNTALDLGYQHSQRLQIAAARAAADVLGMSTAQAAQYQADYRRQRMQIQADSEGLDRWAVHDVNHQGLLQEIRASLAGLRLALDQATGTAAPISSVQVPLLPALDRAESALSNYSASLSQPESQGRSRSENFERGALVSMFFAELIALAWLFFFDVSRTKRNDPLL